MPVIIKKTLQTIPNVAGSLNYLGNGDHKNHRHHTVEAPRFLGNTITNEADFLSALSRATKFLNDERSPSHQLKIAATWWVSSFPAHSNLSKVERTSYEATILSAIGCADFSAVSWHVNIFNGSADLNVIDPGIDLGIIPILRRSNKTNLLKWVRVKSDQWQLKANSARAEERVSLIKTVEEAQAEARADVLRLLKVSCRQQSLVPNVRAIPKILEGAGFTIDDWKIIKGDGLFIRRFPKEPWHPQKRLIARFKMGELIRELFEAVEERGVSLETRDVPDCNTNASPPPKTENAIQIRTDTVTPPLRTRPGVILTNEKPNKQEIEI